MILHPHSVLLVLSGGQASTWCSEATIRWPRTSYLHCVLAATGSLPICIPSSDPDRMESKRGSSVCNYRLTSLQPRFTSPLRSKKLASAHVGFQLPSAISSFVSINPVIPTSWVLRGKPVQLTAPKRTGRWQYIMLHIAATHHRQSRSVLYYGLVPGL